MSLYKPYPAYKESGVEWLGQVPEHWRLIPVCALFKQQKSIGHENEELLSVYRDYGVVPKASRDDNNNKASEDLSTYQLVEPGNLVTNKMKTWQGSIAISNWRGIVSPAYFVFKNLHSETPEYLHHLLRSLPYITGYMAASKGVRVNQWDLDPELFRRFSILLPDQSEQHTIATYLAHETARIDALLEKKGRFIELLQEKRQALITQAVTKGLDPNANLKDSGVKWLGQVPEHWEVKRLKFIASIQTGVAKGKDHSERKVIEVPYLRVANVQDGFLDLSEVTTIEIPEEDLGRYLLQPGDVLMNEGGDYDKLGRGHVWNGEIAPCIHQNHVFSVRPHAVLPDWLNRFTISTAAQFYFIIHAKQSTNLASISSSNLKELSVTVPPEEEQKEILHQLEIRLSRIDALITATQRSMELLKERRAAIITAAVTGQIDLRDSVTGEGKLL